MYQFFVLFFEMDNVIYGLFALNALFIVDTLFSNLLNPLNLCG